MFVYFISATKPPVDGNSFCLIKGTSIVIWHSMSRPFNVNSRPRPQFLGFLAKQNTWVFDLCPKFQAKIEEIMCMGWSKH